MTFEWCLPIVLQSEGGYVNHPSDPGGATNYGITQGTYTAWRASRGLGPIDVREISRAEVATIYRERYWLVAGCEALPWPLCLVHFDAAVNHGPARARQFLAETTDASAYLDRRDAYYRAIVARKPGQAVFLRGWLNRLAHLRSHLTTSPRAA